MSFGPYYIHDGRKWREVNLKDGSIEGWGSAKFVYVKSEVKDAVVKDSLVVAKTNAVLTALRKLQCGEKSAAKDGSRLPHKKINPSHQRGENHHFNCWECRHPHGNLCASTDRINWSHERSEKHHIGCCKCKQPRSTLCTTTNQSHSKAPKTEIQISDENVPKTVQKVDTAIQTAKSFQNLDDAFQIKAKTVQKVDTGIQTTGSTINKDASEHIVIDSSEDDVSPIKSKPTSTPKRLPPIKLKKQWSLAGSDKASAKRRIPTFKLNKENSKNLNLYKWKQSDTDLVDPPLFVVMPKTIVDNKDIIYDGNEYVKSKNIRYERNSSESSRESQQPVKRKLVSLRNFEPKRQKSDEVSHQANSKPLPNLENGYLESHTKRKELMIDDGDVMMLRDFLMKSASDFDLLKFDEDDSYKIQFLYAVNPVVNVERCPKIQQMLHRDSSEISLKDFASQLGLESVSEKSASRRYKMRNDANSENEVEKHSNINNASRKKTEYSDDSDSYFLKEKRTPARKNNQTQQAKVTNEINKENGVSSHKRRWIEIDMDSDFEEQTSNVPQASVKSKANLSVGDLKKNVKRKIDEIFSTKKVTDPDGDNSDGVSSPENEKGKSDTNDSDAMSDKKKQKKKQNKSNVKHGGQNKLSPEKKSTNDVANIDKIYSMKQPDVLVAKTKNASNENRRNESGSFAKPAICEVKSLAVDAKRKLERPTSVASTLARQEYSNFEDHAIVSWVKIGGRARQVNGNRIWKEFEKEYQDITGTHRSWHSLRNRYLRSILPQLGQLALEPGLVSRLRSAAHTGEFKARRAEPRRNSVYGPPPPIGALSRRLRARRSPNINGESPGTRAKPDHSPERHSSPQKDRSSSPDKARRTTRISNLIRVYTDRPRDSSSDSSNDSPAREIPTRSSLKNQTTQKNTPENKSTTRNLSLTKNMSRNSSETKNTPRNMSETKNSSKETPASSTTKKMKKSSSTKRSASRSGRKSTEKAGKKTRKLFNPNSVI